MFLIIKHYEKVYASRQVCGIYPSSGIQACWRLLTWVTPRSPMAPQVNLQRLFLPRVFLAWALAAALCWGVLLSLGACAEAKEMVSNGHHWMTSHSCMEKTNGACKNSAVILRDPGWLGRSVSAFWRPSKSRDPAQGFLCFGFPTGVLFL